ncbi:hypothetical protein DQW50_06645 [Halorubrum sp. 48-1-W]|uniref:VOC family protein n=1 Tax=Halorubrum sp. 48-1-W TaxID=2249761 RepID=UPI000DCE64EC|nr:VOC family protein [Halorubrum sp. 48-1-W]RAW45883.1 hypothetical protein DQW50_06645 [Halorubrum sp. 48-1-W]
MTRSLATPGIHHVTAIAGDPNATHTFYTETLGERLILPEWSEDRREEIEAGLPALETESPSVE